MKLILTGDLHGKDGIYVNILTDYIDYLANYVKQIRYEVKHLSLYLKSSKNLKSMVLLCILYLETMIFILWIRILL
jgi:hypothetical protein